MKQYKSPEVTDLGTVTELTANDGTPQFVDVPQGTPITPGVNIIGSDPNPPPMS